MFSLNNRVLNYLPHTLNQLEDYPNRSLTADVVLSAAFLGSLYLINNASSQLVLGITPDFRLSHWMGASGDIRLFLQTNINFLYEINVWRGLVLENIDTFQKGIVNHIPTEAPFQCSKGCYREITDGLEPGLSLKQNVEDHFKFQKYILETQKETYSTTQDIRDEIGDGWIDLIKIRIEDEIPYDSTQDVPEEIKEGWIDLPRLKEEKSIVWGTTNDLSRLFEEEYQKGLDVGVPTEIPWSEGLLVDGYPWIWGVYTPPVVEVDNKRLSFRCPWRGVFDHSLSFTNITCTRKKFIVSRRSYKMLHTLSLIRISDNTPIHFSKVTASINDDAYTWKFDFTIVGTQSYNNLNAYEPMELQLTINDWTWNLVLTDIKSNHKFKSNSYTATGLGFQAYLSSSFIDKSSYQETSIKTIEQIANYELPSGWVMNWEAPNWVVPANTWDYVDKTKIENIAEISKSVGGLIIPHFTNKEITIRNKYPVMPWNFGTAIVDRVLAIDPIVSKSKSFKKGQNYNKVFVMGDSVSGILGSVKVTGTAGNQFSPNILTNKLITDVDGARAMGEVFIIENLDKYEHQLVLPLSTDIPLVEVGELIRVDESTPWKGMVSSTSISVSLGDKSVSVRQNLSINQFLTDELGL